MRIVMKHNALFALLVMGAQLLASARSVAAEAPEVRMKPKIMVAREGAFRCDASPKLVIGQSLTKSPEVPAVRALEEWRQNRFFTPGGLSDDRPHLPIRIGLAQDDPAFKKLIADHQAEMPKGGLGSEGYALEVTPDHVLIAATQPAGAYYGALRFMEMAAAAGGGRGERLEIPAGTTVDWPDMAWRGLHLLVGGRSDLADLETIITRCMPQYRLNGLILEINYHFRFKSHPEVTEGDALTVEDCRHLKELGDRHGVRIIPMINCLGHQSWAAHTAQLLKSHPEFDETPGAPADNKGLYCRSWCPSNPAVNKLVCDLIDEMVDAFHADAFHVGMDEVFIVGECPRCKGTDHAKLFAKAVNDLHAHIVGKRKLQMLMWGDRLLDGKATGYGEWEASKNGTAPAIDLIPKDIIVCDWHYETRYDDAPATYPSIALFQQKGLRVWPSGWRSDQNVALLVKASQQNRTDRMVGYLATTWIGVGPVAGGLAGDEKRMTERDAAGVAAAIRKGALLAWEGEATAL
jgi:hypothetical protein